MRFLNWLIDEFFRELKNQKSKLKETETVVTKVDGQRYSEKKINIAAI